MAQDGEPFDIFDQNHRYYLQLADGGTLNLGSKEEIDKYALRNPENAIPEVVGQKTWMSNYVITFWMPIMKPDPFAVYVQLTKLSFGEKHLAYPSVGYLMETTGLSRSTVKRALKTLVDLGFVVVIHVKDTRSNTNVPNLFLLANTIPYLTDRQLADLPERLQKMHEKFVQQTKYRSIFD